MKARLPVATDISPDYRNLISVQDEDKSPHGGFGKDTQVQSKDATIMPMGATDTWRQEPS